MKKNIAIVAGGNSSEEVISLKSAELVDEEIDRDIFNVFLIIIKGNDWYFKDDNGKKIQIDKNDFSLTLNNKKIIFACAYIIIHGTPGEDGKLQGYFETIRLPYTTCDVLTSALTFNKHFCKIYLKNIGIRTPKAVLLKKGETINNYSDIVEETGLPCFVKPNAGGSSFGVSKVKELKNLKAAIEKAFEEDNQVLVEQAIEGTEITCGLVKMDNKDFIFPLTEIVSKNEFFDYEAKYTTGMADEITPARIPDNIRDECKKLSSNIYDELNCKGIVRIDYILSNNSLYFFEINTVPGMSFNSIVPQQIRAAGYSVKEIISLLIQHTVKN